MTEGQADLEVFCLPDIYILPGGCGSVKQPSTLGKEVAAFPRLGVNIRGSADSVLLQSGEAYRSLSSTKRVMYEKKHIGSHGTFFKY